MDNASNRRWRAKVNEVRQLTTVFPSWLRRLGYYGLALVLVAVAAMLRWMLPGVLGPTPFLAFYLAWVGAAAFGGLGPGLLATLASWLCAELLFDFTPGLSVFDDPTAPARLAIVLAGGLIVSLVAGRMRRGRIHERRQGQELALANATLRESEEKYRYIVETATEGIVMVDANARVVFTNDRWSEIFGYSLEEAKRMTHFDMVFPEDVAQMTERWESRKRGVKENYEFRFRRKDGRPVWTLIGVAPRLDPEGRFLGTLVMVTDITQRKQAEEALRELTTTLESQVAQRTAELKHRARQLQKLTLDMSETEDRERQRLAEILHDDLQQLLAAAKFQLSLVRNRVKHDPSLRDTTAQIDHMLKEAIAKSRSLSHELSPAVLGHGDFAETLQRLADEVQAKHGLVVHVRANGSIPLQSDAIKAFLYRTAQELLFNVVKHAGVNEAEIGVRQCRRCVCLSVSDRGRGFDPQELPQAAGFGLLSIRERTELLGGHMKIKSAKGQGSRFFIALPAGTESEDAVGVGPRAYRTSPTPGGHGGPPLRVLLADDHEIVRQGLASLLSEDGTVEIVGAAANGREAVDLADRLRPDVVIMDVSMPVMSGDETTRRIKSQLPQTRVVVLSMFEDAEARERMYRAGAESYVLKTAPFEELLAAIRGRSPETVP